MDDAPDSDQKSPSNMPVPVENGDVLPQPEEETTHLKTDQDNNVVEKPKVNGEKEKEDSDKIDSSDCDPDTLIIDEKPTRKRRLLSFDTQCGFKGFKRIKSEDEIEPLTNPYFNESLFELSGLHRNASDASQQNNVTKSVNYSDEGLDAAATTSSISISNFKKGNSKKKSIGSPKLREYAQYLGLQPTVQFKCSRCSQSGFPTLADLNAHQPQCMTQDPVVPTTSTASCTTPSTNFRVTRKVFLCSACGTYYENWNLFLHMRNIHNRFVCLYCLGMFSQPEKLTLHLASKHNCVPRHLSEEEFFREYKEPCYLMCCDCLTVFGETDDFYGHQCNCKSKHNNSENKNNKSTNSITNRPSTSQKSVTSKINKQNKTKSEFVEHVTGDTQIVSSSNNNESDNLNESVGLQSLEVAHNTTENSLPEEQLPEQESQEEEESKTQIENQSEIVEANNLDSNSRISMETDNEKAPNVETEVSNDKSSEDSSQNKENSGNVEIIETKDSASEEDEMDDDSNKSFDDKSRSPSPCDNNFDEDPTTTEQPNFDETLNDIDDLLHSNESQQEDTRKVPKVTLKLPKIIPPYVENGDSEDSDKLTMELDSMDYENDLNNEASEEKENEEEDQQLDHPEIPEFAVAGAEIPITELELEQPLDKFDIKILLQKCLKQTIASCIYCNHARKIAVNGKQLALHAIAEHRFSAVVNSITAEELIPETFVMRIRESFSELESVFFSIESNGNEEGVTFSHIFECFQCRYATAVHKELYLHNRKMHAKTILLCIMCKSNFYSYSELICHLCPGIYESQEVNSDISFRCCMCVSNDLPSAFRLMVHLRKRHHICDVCLELCNNQSKLSNHVWKHKLHHLCYRCGVAYRNKPDITKHLFWKHGTESVLCKKCLQKKWPHVYHFCIPPSTFTCEECNLNFSKAVALKVHKRMHDESKPHECTFEGCEEKFISKRLLLKHEFKHREPPEDTKAKEVPAIECVDSKEELVVDSPTPMEEPALENPVVPEVIEKKPKVDVYDLPALNLSESDTSDSEEEMQEKKEDKVVPKEDAETTIQPEVEEVANKCEDEPAKMEIDHDLPSGGEILESTSTEPIDQILHVWDNFKNYQAKHIKIDAPNSEMETDAPQTVDQPSSSTADGEIEMKQVVEVINKDHDYCTVSETIPPEMTPNPVERSQSIDHDYCFSNNKSTEPVPEEKLLEKVEKPKSPVKSEKKESKDTSDSSGDSDSSSCECNSNCSCSSSSDSSSSSSDSSESDSSSSEGRRKQQARRERRRTAKQRGSPKKEPVQKAPEIVKPIEPHPHPHPHPQIQTEEQIEESDLYTSESETDEEFYDQQPQKLANKLMMEKRKMLLAGVNTNINGSILESSRPSTPSLPETEAVKLQKKKSKNKKKKKKSKKQAKALALSNIPSSSYQFQYQQPIVSPLTLSIPKSSPCPTPTQSVGVIPHYDSKNESIHSNDSSKRASKRRRIPNKFYGYSSDEEHEKYQPPVLKWPKADLPSPARQTPVSPQTVPPITIRTIPSFVPVVEEPVVPRLVIPTPRENKTFQPFHRPPPIPMARQPEQDSCTETNESSSEEEQQVIPPPLPPPTTQPPFVTSTGPQPPLYCYCRCPYDEVSEMIGCDASDCAIEWFHFECVGIMVPPKGQWFCPDCRKKTQYAREYLASSPV